jgi:membrane carboxypeptidase/penicillin-binding protein
MLLENVVTNGISAPLRWAHGFTRPVGGKTGTTNDNKDTWFCGITPELAAGVWCGYDRPRGLGRGAAGVAMPVWARAMNRMLADFPMTAFVDDPSLVHVLVDDHTEGIARPDCPWKAPAAFVPGTLPDTCRVNHRADWDAIVLESVTSDSLAGIEDSIGTTTLRLSGAPPFARPRATPAPGAAADSAAAR